MAMRGVVVPAKKKRSFGACEISMCAAIVATVSLRNWSIVVYAAQAAMILCMAWRILQTKQTLNNLPYLVAYGLFAALIAASCLWAMYPNRVFGNIAGIVQFVALGFFISAYAISEKKVTFVLDCLAWSAIAAVVVLVAVTPSADWASATQLLKSASSSENRIGATITYHPNTLGHICAISTLLWIHEFKARRYPRSVCFAAIVALLVVLLFTKSRLSLVFFIVAVVVYSLLAMRGRWYFSAVASAIPLTIGLGVVAVLAIPSLYDFIGFRVAGMLGTSGDVDSSVSMRMRMFAVGLDIFGQNPLFGVGFDNFAPHYYYDYSGHRSVYSHSNLSEILADLGLVGFLLYYAIPLWALVQLIQQSRKTHCRDLTNLFIAILLVQLVSDVGSMSYANDFTQMTIALAYAFAVCEKRSVMNRVKKAMESTWSVSRCLEVPHVIC